MARTALLIAAFSGTFAAESDSRRRGALLGSLVADALCLGSHYEYDAPTIKAAYGGRSIETYMAPGERMGGTTHGVGWGRRNYHPGQRKGDGTDYGEYNLLMLEYLASRPKADFEAGAARALDLNSLVPFWSDRLGSSTWGAWRCTQTKQTLQQVAAGAPMSSLGGMSNAMSMRSAAAVAAMNSEEEAALAARKMMFTHRSEEALSGGEFFTRVAWKVAVDGLQPRAAIDATAAQMGGWIEQQVRKGIAKYEEATDTSRPLAAEEFVDDLAITSMARLWDVGKTEPIKVGKASPTEGTLPASVYIILKYVDDFAAAAKANAMVGGDNASRAVAIGMVLGAYHGVEGIPQALREGLNAWRKSEKLLDELAAVRSTAPVKGEL